MSLEAWNWQELLLVREFNDEVGHATEKDDDEINTLLYWNFVTSGSTDDLWKVFVCEPLFLGNWRLGWQEHIGQELKQRTCDGTWEQEATKVGNDGAKVGEVILWVVALIHDTAPLWNTPVGNGISDVLYNLSAIHGSPCFLEISEHSRLCWKVLDHHLVAEVRDHRDHEVVKPGTDEGVGLMHECGADGKGCHDFLLVVLEFGRGRPVVIAHLGNGVVVGNIACIVAWLIGHDAIPAEADIWSVVVLIKWWQTAFEAWGALAPWVRSSHVVLVGSIRLPVLVNTSPGSNLRCVQRRVVVLVEALNKFVVVRLIV